MTEFDTIENAVAAITNGEFVVVLDDEERENEGDLICSAQLCTEDQVNFLARFARGLICTPLTAQRAAQLELSDMVQNNTALHGTKFTVSIDYVHGTTTGISAHDRSATIRALASPSASADDFGRPGHIFPLIAADGGVLRRAGHTEAALDLMKLAGLEPVGVLCEILNDNGTMARTPDLMQFAREHNFPIITVKHLIAYRLASDRLVECIAEAELPTDMGKFTIKVFRNILDGSEHVALVKGVWEHDEPVLVRVHSECLTGDIFHSLRCDCGNQLEAAMHSIAKAGKGVLLYMRQEGRGIGLANKIRAYKLQESGLDTVQANEALGFKPDPRDYGIGAQILVALGVKNMKLMTNNPQKRIGLESYGLNITERVPIEIAPNDINLSYLQTKKSKMGHLLSHL